MKKQKMAIVFNLAFNKLFFKIFGGYTTKVN